MRLIAGLLLLMFVGPVVYMAVLFFWPIVRPSAMTIAFAVYIAFALVELVRGLYESYSIWREATARLSGGFFILVVSVLARAKFLVQSRVVVSATFEAIAYAIAWPLPMLARKMARRVNTGSISAGRPPRLYSILIYRLASLNAKVITILILCLLLYVLAVFVRLDALGLQLMFGTFIVFCNATMLSLALQPGGLATMLRQHESPRLL